MSLELPMLLNSFHHNKRKVLTGTDKISVTGIIFFHKYPITNFRYIGVQTKFSFFQNLEPRIDLKMVVLY